MSDLPPTPEEVEQVLALGCDTIVHPFCPDSCAIGAFMVFKDGFIQASKVYVPFFLIPALILKRGDLKFILQRTIPNILRASTFMGSLAGGMLPVACFLRFLFGKFSPATIFFAGFVNGFLSSFIEERKRRTEVTLYSCNQAIEAICRMLAIRGYLPNVKYSDVALFVLGSSILGYFFHYEPHHLKNVQSVIGFVTGTKPIHGSGDSKERVITENEVHGNGTIDDNFIQSEDVATCKHSCIRSTALKFLRGLCLGFGIRGSINLATNIVTKRLYRKPRQLIKASFGSSTRNFALFLAFFSASWSGVACLLRNLRKKEDKYNQILAGAVAGLSISFSRNTEISMYFVSKAVEGIFNSVVAKYNIKPVKHADAALFGLACALIFYCSVLEPYNLRPSYWAFLYKMSDGRYNQFERIARAYKPEFFKKTGFQYFNKT